MALPQRTAMGMSLLAAIAVSASAHAQNLSLGDNQDAIVRDGHDSELANNEINKADCVRDENIRFNLGITGVKPDGYNVEVWKGTGCATERSRFEDTSNCVQIDVPIPERENSSIDIFIPVRLLVSATKDSSSSSAGSGGTSGTGGTDSGGTAGSSGGGTGGTGAGGSGATTGGGGAGGTDTTSGTGGGGTSGSAGEGGETTYPISLCDGDRSYDTPQDLNLHFIVTDGNGDQPTSNYTPATWAAKYDLVGPDAPTGVSAGIGENTLILSWHIEDSRGDIDRYYAYCDPPPGTTPTHPDQCGSNLPEGMEPTDVSQYFCGESDGYSASMETSPLQNGVTYAVAVAGVDNFKNVGLLSIADCEAPQLVTDFYEAYRRAGGEGGGGFCAMGAKSSHGFAAFLALGALAWAARRRATRSRREAR